MSRKPIISTIALLLALSGCGAGSQAKPVGKTSAAASRSVVYTAKDVKRIYKYCQEYSEEQYNFSEFYEKSNLLTVTLMKPDYENSTVLDNDLYLCTVNAMDPKGYEGSEHDRITRQIEDMPADSRLVIHQRGLRILVRKTGSDMVSLEIHA